MHRRAFLGAGLALLSGCGATRSPSSPSVSPSPAPSAASSTTGRSTRGYPPADAPLGLTYHAPTGNRLVAGQAALPEISPTTYSLPGTPRWLVGVPAAAGATRWVVVLDGGRAVGLHVGADGTAERVAVTPESVPGPPALVGGTAPRRLTCGTAHSHPVPFAGGLAFVAADGRVVIESETGRSTHAVDALPDARPISDGRRLYVLARATTEYRHGVLGDAVEAGGVAVFDADGQGHRRTLPPPDGTVIEGIAPIVTDLGGDRVVLVTASDGSAGARLLALDPSGGVLARGPPVGTGFRWRHQLAVAPFGPAGRREVAVVRTPHIGGVAEFYRREGDRLVLAATEDGGYATHRIGSRNLDMALAGRFDGGRPRLLVPAGDGRRLVALARREDGVEEAWSLPLGGRLTTNLAAATVEGTIRLAAGVDGGLRLWG